ncbi:heparinase II/III family protein [Arenibacter sp. BSSL-BM3]|uniref:Heparinase II/III family protein n=1 Tax=Arenibacter arenosicollis TaxID=2762274 RepID=A0ABR7QQ39_9FLAO|nr:heparinase II/III family protein [Arenibacter arenosicollis]MBC8769300.1 heparinase II/III family protein [Arenibacter arenosicollis]
MLKIIKPLSLIILFFCITTQLSAQQNWKSITSVEDLITSYPETIENMLDQFNLDYIGLEKVKLAHSNGNMLEACNELLAYYKNGAMASDLRKETPLKTTREVAAADTILTNVFVVQNVRGKVPYLEDGHRDWYYKGPNNDKEWAWLSNRHSQLSQIFNTYLETGNPKYAEYMDLFLRDFIIKSMPYPAVKSGTSVWRGLEVAARAKIWTKIFYGLINNDYISPATKLLLLSSLPDHAHYNRNFHAGNNWLTMEISALATVAAYFPEYKNSEEWLDYAIETMTQSMKDQVYPDGVQTELSSHYHNVSLNNFELFKEICERANRKLPDFYNSTIEAMYGYIAHMVRPSGFRLMNNDGDRGSDQSLILRGSQKFDHEDWEYIVTNGKTGRQPEDGPSYFYPWAGHFISRSGFDQDAHWSFFDMGPWGSGHQHNDKLHLSVSAYGKDFLVDSGRFAYTGEVAEKFRPYAKGSAGHNLILIDGKGQTNGPTHTQDPLTDSHFKITETFDYASNSFDQFIDLAGKAKHARAIFYVRNEFWVVVDRVETDRPRTIEALWHWHPDNKVEKEKSIVKTTNERGNLTIIPVGKQKINPKFIKGQENPEIQGWYSPEYNIYGPNITSSYTIEIGTNTTFVWLLFPSEKEIPKIKAKIESENEQEITVGVTSEGKKWQLTIPFNNSSKAKLITP